MQQTTGKVETWCGGRRERGLRASEAVLVRAFEPWIQLCHESNSAQGFPFLLGQLMNNNKWREPLRNPVILTVIMTQLNVKWCSEIHWFIYSQMFQWLFCLYRHPGHCAGHWDKAAIDHVSLKKRNSKMIPAWPANTKVSLTVTRRNNHTVRRALTELSEPYWQDIMQASGGLFQMNALISLSKCLCVMHFVDCLDFSQLLESRGCCL